MCWRIRARVSRCSPPVTKSWTSTFLPAPARSATPTVIRWPPKSWLPVANRNCCPLRRDEPARLRELITDGLDADLLLLTGGVSMGKYDLVEQVLAELQAEFFFTGAQIQPGRPIVFGRIPSNEPSGKPVYFFGLPGNPVSTMVTFELFARPILEALAGLTPRQLTFLAREAEVRNQSPPRVKTIPSRHPFRRIRTRRSRTGPLAGLGRHRRHRPGQLLHRDSRQTVTNSCR